MTRLSLILAVLALPAAADDLSRNETAALTLCLQAGPDHDGRVALLERAGWHDLGLGRRDEAVEALAAAQAPLILLAQAAGSLSQAHSQRRAELAVQSMVIDPDGIPTVWMWGGSGAAMTYLLLETTSSGGTCSIALGRPMTAAELAVLTGAPAEPRPVEGATLQQYRDADDRVLLNAVIPDAGTFAQAGIPAAPVLLVISEAAP